MLYSSSLNNSCFYWQGTCMYCKTLVWHGSEIQTLAAQQALLRKAKADNAEERSGDLLQVRSKAAAEQRLWCKDSAVLEQLLSPQPMHRLSRTLLYIFQDKKICMLELVNAPRTQKLWESQWIRVSRSWNCFLNLWSINQGPDPSYWWWRLAKSERKSTNQG